MRRIRRNWSFLTQPRKKTLDVGLRPPSKMKKRSVASTQSDEHKKSGTWALRQFRRSTTVGALPLDHRSPASKKDASTFYLTLTLEPDDAQHT